MFRDIITTTYALKEGDTPVVECGAPVAAGDLIATGSGPSLLVPYAATLRLSVDAATDALARHDGTACTVGASLGTRRVGLVTHTVSALAGGTVRSLPKSGALAISDEAAVSEHRARYGGTVHAISDRTIAVTSEVARCVYAFADDIRSVGPLHIEPALLDTPHAEVMILRVPQALSSTVIAHIGDAAHLSALVRSFHSTLFVGSVEESVAWALFARWETRAARRAKGAHIVVLSGVGDMHTGMQAVAPFHRFHGAAVALDQFTQIVTIIPPADHDTDMERCPASGLATGWEQRDPANYGVPCAIQHNARIAATGTGTRALCVLAISDSAGEQLIPMQNLQQLQASGD